MRNIRKKWSLIRGAIRSKEETCSLGALGNEFNWAAGRETHSSIDNNDYESRASINLTNLVGGLDAPIRFECYDYDSDGTTDYIGYFATTLSKFATANAEFLLTNPRKKTKLKYEKRVKKRGG